MNHIEKHMQTKSLTCTITYEIFNYVQQLQTQKKYRSTRPEPVVGRRRRWSASSLSPDGDAAGIDNNFI